MESRDNVNEAFDAISQAEYEAKNISVVNEIREQTLPKIPFVESDSYGYLKRFTDARIALGRTGVSQPTKHILAFEMARAQAVDAVRKEPNFVGVEIALRKLCIPVQSEESAVKDREEYLTRPDLGRRLSEASKISLQAFYKQKNLVSGGVVFVIGDGLSGIAIDTNAVPFMETILPYLEQLKLKPKAIVVLRNARVACADEINEILKGDLVVHLIGERPGLSSPDSMGIYMTYGAHVGSMDSERNCISNIRPRGLSWSNGAFKLAWLMREAWSRKVTGVELKDESDLALPNDALRLIEVR